MTITACALSAVSGQRRRLRAFLPGLTTAVAIAVLASALGRWAPIIGAPVIGIVLGVVLSGRAAAFEQLRPGVRFASNNVLQLAVVVLGAQLSLRQVASVGAGSLPVMLATLAVCLTVAYFLGRGLGIETDLRTLIGVGTGICGASAIAAVSPTIRAKNPAIAYAISTIFLFNIAAVLVFPPLGHLLGLSQHSFGLFAGTAVNDTSSVVAAAASYGTGASNYAIVVKLTRSLMIIPVVLVLAAVVHRRDHSAASAEGTSSDTEGNAVLRVIRLVPWFLAGFMLVAAANSIGWVPVDSRAALQIGALFLVTVALAGIGLSTDFAAVRRAGPRPVLLGLTLWVAVAATSLGVQALGA